RARVLSNASHMVGHQQKREKGGGRGPARPFSLDFAPPYCCGAASPAAAFLRLSQLYLRWNFSTRPVVSTNFILPVKNGWHAEQISTVMFLRVLRVVNLLPQPHVTVASTYFG